MSRLPVVPAVLLATSLALVGCAKGEKSPGAADSGQAGTGQAGTCSYPSAGQPAKPVDPPSGGSVASAGKTAITLTVDGAPVVLTLDRGQAACAVNSFESLAKQGWYTNTSCHRLTDQGIFVLQCGDPTGTGSGGPGYTFADELEGAANFAKTGQRFNGRDMVTYPKGTVAMANSGPNTNGSQIFLVWQDSPLLPDYTVLGTMDEESVQNVAKVAAEGVAADGTKPNAPALISDVTMG